MENGCPSASTSQSEGNHGSTQNFSDDPGLSLNESPSQNDPCNTASRKRKAEFKSETAEFETSVDSDCQSAPSNAPKHSRRAPHDPDSPPFDWQSTAQSIKDRTAYIFEHGLFCDVHFNVGQGPLAQRIPAHKFILSIGSAVFDAMFSSDWSAKSEDIEVPDVEPAAFSALLRYLYTDDVTVTADTVMAILYAAKKYAVPSLQKKCLNFLSSNLCSDNAFMLLSQARVFDEQDLVKLCLKKIDYNAERAFASGCFADIDSEVLCLVLCRNTLRIREIQLFEAVCRWSKAELARKNLVESPENHRSVLERVLPLVRFPLMALKEISSTVAISELLSDKQLVSLYRYLTVSPKPPLDFNTIPRGSSKSNCLKRFHTTYTTTPLRNVENVADAIGFCCDHDVWIMGFGLYGPVRSNSEVYHIALALTDTVTGNILHEDSYTLSVDSLTDIYRFKLRQPVRAIACTNYTFKFNITGPDSCMGLGGKKDMTIDLKYGGQITFSFNTVGDPSDNSLRSSVEQGQIPEILFRFF